jgi:hypothetical protein
VRHADGSYNILGRASDSYVNEKGERIYLFQIEYSLDEDDPILEWEVSAFKNECGGHDVVGQIILDPACKTPKNELVDYFCKKYHFAAVKFYEEFELGEITNKRDFVLLAHDYKGYVSPCDENHHYLVNYSEDGTTERRKVAIIHYQY